MPPIMARRKKNRNNVVIENEPNLEFSATGRVVESNCENEDPVEPNLVVKTENSQTREDKTRSIAGSATAVKRKKEPELSQATDEISGLVNAGFTPGMSSLASQIVVINGNTTAAVGSSSSSISSAATTVATSTGLLSSSPNALGLVISITSSGSSPSGRNQNNMKGRETRSCTRSSSSVAAELSPTSNNNDVTGSPGKSTSNQPESSGVGQSSTPRTPGSPPDHGAHTPNPPTPGNTNSNSMVSSSPQYVTITEGADNRHYASLTAVNPAVVDGDGGVGSEDVNVGGNSSYVTYVDGSTDHNTLYAAAAAAAANGQTMSYPVYSVGDSGTMYTSGSTQFFSSNIGVAYGQGENEEGEEVADGSIANADYSMLPGSGASSIVTSSPENDTNRHHHHALLLSTRNNSPHSEGGVYLVSSSENNNNGGLESDGTTGIAHATRVSPATQRKKIFTNSKKVKQERFLSDTEEDDFKQNDSDETEDHLPQGDDVVVLTEAELAHLAKMNVYPVPGNGFPAMATAFKSCPVTVQWLLENYETVEGVSLPRSTLYNHYLRHCADHKLDPVNAASFGKLIRSVFLGLRTRRLGTRGNSKYHYYGIRLKPNSPLNQFNDDGFPISTNGNSNSNGVENGSASGGVGNRSSGGNNNNSNSKRMKMSKGEGYDSSHINGFGTGDTVTVQFLGDPSRALEDFPDLDISMQVPEGLVQDDVLIFRSLYRDHCEALLDGLVNFQLGQVELYWRAFWRAGDVPPNAAIIDTQDYEKILPKQKLVLLCTMKEVQDFVRDADYRFYQNIVGILLPDVLRPIPSAMTQSIRNFAKALEGWLTSAMIGYPEEMVQMKISVVNALAQTLRRYTSLNHLAQAARAVLQNQNQIAQMLTDLNRVDFHNVEEQASWVCGCDRNIVPSLELDFKGTLALQQSLEQWATWLEGVVDRILRPHMSSPQFVHAARQFLLKWSFYSSLIIRDLTLRSAASFGSFHLLRLLYDEYMFYLVEHRVAQVTGVVPIAVIGKKFDDVLSVNPSTSPVNDGDSRTKADINMPRFETSAASSPMNGHGTVGGIISSSSLLAGAVTATSTSGTASLTNQTQTAATIASSHHNHSPNPVAVKVETKRVKNFLTA